MKRLLPVLVTTLLATGGAHAQSIGIGPGGISVDPRTPRERAVDREIRREERMEERDRWERRREWERRRAWREERRCRTETRIFDTPRGEVRRTERVCD